MKTSDIVQLLRSVEAAIEAAGRGEFRALKLMQELDRLGYEIARRPASTPVLTPVDMQLTVETTAETDERDRLFND